MKSIRRFIIISVLFTLISGGAFAAEEKGKLDKFEEEIEEPARHQESHTAESHVSEGLLEMFADIFLLGLMTGTTMNYADLRQELKQMESPALPTIRFESSYQYVFDGVHGFSGNLEAGYLMFGVDGEFLYYWESANNDNIKIGSGHFLLRTLFTHIMQVDMALGVKTFQGNMSYTGFDIGFPIYFFFGKHIIWDIKPYITVIRGRDIYDFSSGLSYKYRMMGIRAAYRAINVSHETLHGPQVGMFFQW